MSTYTNTYELSNKNLGKAITNLVDEMNIKEKSCKEF